MSLFDVTTFEETENLLKLGHNLLNTYQNGYLPIHVAANNGYIGVIKSMINNGVDINILSINDHKTPLMIACEHGYIDVIEGLISIGADINFKSDKNVTALMVACYNGYIDAVITLLNSNANVNDCDVNGKSVLMYAIQNGNCNIINHLLVYGADPLHFDNFNHNTVTYACMYARLDALRLMINLNVDVNVIPHKGGFPALMHACIGHDLQMLKILIENGCDLKITTPLGKTALDIAKKHDRQIIVEFLEDLKIW